MVRTITGVEQRETIPDQVVRRADQIELVDMAPEALRRRLAHGNVYAAEKVDAALANYFRVGNLTALRELALLWVADRVDEGLARYRAEQGIDAPWPTRERVVVALTGGPEGEVLVRRGARIAGRTAGRELVAVHIARGDGLSGATPDALARQRVLVESLGGTFHTVVGDDVAAALLDFARGVNATQLVVGVSRHARWRHFAGGSVADAVARGSGEIDVHLVTHEAAGHKLHPRRRRALSGPRLVTGWLLAALGPVALAMVLLPFRDDLSLSSDLLLFLTLTVGVALVGGLWPALVGAVVSSLVLNWVFTPPYGTLTIAQAENALALVIFVLVAGSVASVVDLAARRTSLAARAQSEAATLSTLAGSVLSGADSPDELISRLRETFGLTSVTLLEQQPDLLGWTVVATAGWPPCTEPGTGDTTVAVSDTLVLVLKGRPLLASDQRVLEAYAARIGSVLDRERLAALAATADRLAEGNEVRTALLAAVSHDLRSPLAGIKAAVSSLRQDDVDWSEADEAALLATIEESTDRLDGLVANLLDLSRLQTGSVVPRRELVDAADLVGRAVASLPDAASRVTVHVGDALPLATTDAALVERVVANLVENALRYAPGPVLIDLGCVGRAARGARRRPRAWGRRPGEGADVRAVPAARRRARGDRGRPRPGGRPWSHRGGGWPADRRGHPWWRADDGAVAAVGADRRTGAGGRSARDRAVREHAAGGGAMTRVLVVDDEEPIARALAINLRARRYDVDVAPDGRTALELAAARHPDLVLLDLGLPDIDGTEVIAGLRGWTDVPIIVLSARQDSSDKVLALDAGADDYVTKPFGMDELLARLRAALRRGAAGEPEPDPVVVTNEFTVDLAAKRVVRDGAEVRLTPTEWHILEILVRNRGRLVSQKQLLREVWGPAYEKETHYLRVYMAQLRSKLEATAGQPQHLMTEPGMGYRFEG